MKKLLLILSLFLCVTSYGQLDYTLTKSSSTYTVLPNPTMVKYSWIMTTKVTMPFQFTFFKKPFSNLMISPYSVGFTLSQSDYISLGMEDYDSTRSNISYLITGTSPNRIIKVQYDMSAPTSDTSEEYRVNNQIWLYETSNKIEFHFGPSIITDVNFTEFFFGFRDADGSPYLAVSGTAANPTIVQVTNVGTFKGINSHPTDGTVYTFSVNNSSISKVVRPYQFTNTRNAFSILPERESTIIISDISGKQISTSGLDADKVFSYDYSSLSTGMYLVTINSNNQSYTEKIIVQ